MFTRLLRYIERIFYKKNKKNRTQPFRKNEPASVIEHAGLRHKQSVRLQSISRGL